jgi:hypothetical protein
MPPLSTFEKDFMNNERREIIKIPAEESLLDLLHTENPEGRLLDFLRHNQDEVSLSSDAKDDSSELRVSIMTKFSIDQGCEKVETLLRKPRVRFSNTADFIIFHIEEPQPASNNSKVSSCFMEYDCEIWAGLADDM